MLVLVRVMDVNMVDNSSRGDGGTSAVWCIRSNGRFEGGVIMTLLTVVV